MQTPPILQKPIPPQVINELAAYRPFDLKSYLKSPDESPLHFQAELLSGEPLPKGMICTSDGILTGIPGKGTQGNYEVRVTAKNDAGSIKTQFFLTIKPSLLNTGMEFADQLKKQVWEALEKGMPIPDLSELYDRPITPLDIYYLLERWGMLTIWDAYNLDPAGEKVLLNLEDASPHYNVYDRGSCLVATPKDLFSYERTLEDGLQTARAMAREVYRRGWAIQMAGFYKLMRATWIEIQQQVEQYGKPLEIINFAPDLKDIALFQRQAALKPKIRG